MQGALDGVKPVAQALRDRVILALGRQRLRRVAGVSGLAVHLGLAVLLARRLGVLQQALHLVALGNEQAARAVLVHRAVLPRSVRDARAGEDHPERQRHATQPLGLGPIEAAQVRFGEALRVIGMEPPCQGSADAAS